MQFKRVTHPDDADANAILVMLFKCEEGLVRGWLVGPVLAAGKVPYEPRSKKLHGAVALIRACRLAELLGLDCYLIDPNNLYYEISN